MTVTISITSLEIFFTFAPYAFIMIKREQSVLVIACFFITIELSLLVKHICIDAALGIKLGMFTVFYYLSVIKNSYFISKLNSRKTMGDKNSGSIPYNSI